MSEGVRRYLVVAQFSRGAVGSAGASLLENAERISASDPHLAFTSERGDTVGVLVRSEMFAGQIIYSLTSSYDEGEQPFVLVLEIGDDWSDVGAQASWKWLRDCEATRHSRVTQVQAISQASAEETPFWSA